MNAILGIHSISKDYGPVRVVDGVSIEIAEGTVHALLGENGAGKSTLIKMISGQTSPSDGRVTLRGETIAPRSVKEAQALGIVALPQELTLVPGLDASENIHLGLAHSSRVGIVNRRDLRRRAAEQLARLGQDIPLGVPVGELSAVQQTMVALARALARDARVLILDEPTAALTDTETQQLFDVLRRLRADGTAIVYVSHRLEEVFALADVATVMRNGQLVWTKSIADTSPDDVVSALIGRSQDRLYPDRATITGREVLRLEAVSGKRVRDVTLSAYSGRVLGIAGLAGAGRSELVRIIAGAQKATAGTVTFYGAASETSRDGSSVDAAPRATRLGDGSVRRAMAAGVALVPEERRAQGLVLDASIHDNIALASLATLSTAGIASRRREREAADAARTKLQIKAASLRQPVSQLSGGNQQKVVLGKYLLREPQLLLLDEPTRGIDVGTKAEIYTLIRTLVADGVAVIVVSSELPELLGIADDIAVMHEGRLAGLLDAATTDENTLLQHCYGRQAHD